MPEILFGTVRKRGDLSLPPHVHDAIERVHETTQDCLGYLRQDDPKTKAATIVYGKVRNDWIAALQSLPSLVGQTLTRTTSTGREVSVTITSENLIRIRAIVGAVYELAQQYSVTNERIEPVVPVTRPLATAVATKLANVSYRTWTEWMPWLHLAGVVVYQHGTHTHPSLIGIPSLYRAHVHETRQVLKGRFVNGFTVSVSDKEVAKRGRWWEPICGVLLDEISDAHERAAAYAQRLMTWCERAGQALIKKRDAILEHVVNRSEQGALVYASRRLETARQAKAITLLRYRKEACLSDHQRLARRRTMDALDRAILNAEREVRAAHEQEGNSPARAMAAVGHKALNERPLWGGGGSGSSNDLQDYYVVLEGKAAQASPAKPDVRPTAVIDVATHQNTPSRRPPAPEAGQEGVRGVSGSPPAPSADETLTGLAKTAREVVEAAGNAAAAAAAHFALFTGKKPVPIPAGAG